MSKAQLAITTVVVEGRGKSEVAQDYDVSRYLVQQLCQRYQREPTGLVGNSLSANGFRHRLVGAEVHPARHQLAKVAGRVIAAAESGGVTS